MEVITMESEVFKEIKNKLDEIHDYISSQKTNELGLIITRFVLFYK